MHCVFATPKKNRRCFLFLLLLLLWKMFGQGSNWLTRSIYLGPWRVVPVSLLLESTKNSNYTHFTLITLCTTCKSGISMFCTYIRTHTSMCMCVCLCIFLLVCMFRSSHLVTILCTHYNTCVTNNHQNRFSPTILLA